MNQDNERNEVCRASAPHLFLTHRPVPFSLCKERDTPHVLSTLSLTCFNRRQEKGLLQQQQQQQPFRPVVHVTTNDVMNETRSERREGSGSTPFSLS